MLFFIARQASMELVHCCTLATAMSGSNVLLLLARRERGRARQNGNTATTCQKNKTCAFGQPAKSKQVSEKCYLMLFVDICRLIGAEKT